MILIGKNINYIIRFTHRFREKILFEYMSIKEYFSSTSSLFVFAFFLTLFIGYLEKLIFRIRKPLWAHFKNALTCAFVASLCVYIYKMNEKVEIFTGEME